MTQEEQRVAIAKMCGYKFQGGPPYLSNESVIAPAGPLICYKNLPDYFNNLDAVHEAENILIAQGKGCLIFTALMGLCSNCVENCVHAEASVRAKAVIQVMNL